MQRNKLFPSMMGAAGSKLKDLNKKRSTLRASRNAENPLKQRQKLYQKNQTSRHIEKYKENEKFLKTNAAPTLLSDSFFQLHHDEAGFVSIELNDAVFRDHSAEEREDFHRDFVSKLHGFLQEDPEMGLKKLSQFPPPTLSDVQNQNFTLQGFYERWNQDLDSVDLTTDGVNTQIQKRLSKEQSAD